MITDHAPHSHAVFNALPGASALIYPDSPHFTVVAVTNEFAAFAGTSREEMTGNSVFMYFPDNPDAPNVSNDIRASLAICIETRKKNELAIQRYDIAGPDGTFSEMYWTVIHTPVLDSKGEIEYIIHTAIDVTDRVLSEIKDARIRSMQTAHNLFKQSAVAIHIFMGPDKIIELANAPTLKIWDRDESVIGKSFKEILPEVEEKYLEIIDEVRTTGKSFHAHEAPVNLKRFGNEKTAYFNFVLQPYFEDGKSGATGVIAMVNEVTQIINDRKALEQKERTLELAVEIGELGIFNIDLKTDTISYSPQVMNWFGVNRLKVPIETLISKVYPEDYELVRKTFARTEAGDTLKHDLTFRVPHPQTGEIQYLHSIGQLQFEDGMPAALSGIIRNVTATVNSQEAIAESAHRLKSVIESAPFPIGVYVGKEMMIALANESIVTVWGKEDVMGKRYADVLPELEGTGIYQQLDDVYETGISYHADHQRVDLFVDGQLREFYFNYQFTPLFDSVGKVYGVMNTAADVTDLIIAKQKIEQSERNFRNIILQAPVAMCLLRGESHSVEVVNKSMLSIWDKSADEVLERPIFEGLEGLRDQGFEQIFSKVYRTGETVAANERAIKLPRNGREEIMYHNFVCEPYRDGDGTILGILAISVDVTAQVVARRKIEDVVRERTKELELANSSLQRSNAELEQFAYIASHDLQEPLRKISMYTEMLERSLTEASQRDKDNMNRITNAVRRMTNLIVDILSYSQLTSNTGLFVQTHLEDVFRDATSDFDFVMANKGAVITHEGLSMIDAMPSQLVQLFNNLLSNSLKYSKPDVAPEINVKARKITNSEASVHFLPENALGYVEIVFKDNGIGFAQEYAAQIFNIFQRLHAKTEYEGTGIGLALCKKIVDNHHGKIFATATEGQGAEFTVILPVRQS